MSAVRSDVEWLAPATVRWLRPLPLVVIAVVVWTAARTDPEPDLHGRGLAVTVAVAVLVASGLLTVLGPIALRPWQLASTTVVVTASVTLMGLQPDGVGVAGVFVGLALLAPQVGRYRAIPAVVVALVFAAVLVATLAGHRSATDAVLNAITLAAFFAMLFLAVRLGRANRRSALLVAELERRRAVEAEASALAERQRVAREMHDVLAHSLAGMLLQLEAAQLLVAADPSDPRLPATVARARALGRSGLDEAREAIGLLRDDALPGPDRLGALAAEFAADHGVRCTVRETGTAAALPPQARLALYRAAQEALTNVAKHAAAESVEIALHWEDGTVGLVVEDIGAPAAAAEPGYGLTGMRERAELLGGTLTAGPTATGHRVEVRLPR